ncbi:MAG: hypothetical protein AAF797_16000, partial [Planctomycetota bacterium]
MSSTPLPTPLPPSDLVEVTALLGHDPGRGAAVATRNAQDRPVVLRCYPLRFHALRPPQPFPTLYWLL